MKIKETNIEDAVVITTDQYEDERGFFIESFNSKEFEKHVSPDKFVQDNHSRSFRGVLRGLHYQIEHPQGKLVRCISGSICDVIVDLRKSSPTFGNWFSINLSSPNVQLWAPAGLAHGFYVLSEVADVCYKITDYYYPKYDRTLIWNDSQLQIDWPLLNNSPSISEKDKIGKTFIDCEKYD